MANAYETGVVYTSAIPAWQRQWYSAALLETLRTKSLMMPYCAVKEDFNAVNSGIITYTEVMDTDPNYNPLTEDTIWMAGSHMDTRSVNLELAIYGDTLKYSDYADVKNYLNNGDYRGLVRTKIGQNQVDMMDILARNAFLSHPNKIYAGGARANRAAITATDYFDPDFAELARTHLEEAEVPGVVAVQDSDIQTIVCVTTPRVVHDIRTASGSDWLAVEQYAGGAKKFSGEVGTWNGVRFVKTNRLVLRNHGAVTQQTTLDGATVAGQGAAATVDVVYTVGQSTSTRYIVVDDVTGFAVGDIVTIHSKDAGEGAGKPPVETDGTQETRRIVAIDVAGKKISFDRPLMKPHADTDFLTKGIPIHTSIFMGGPAVVYGVAERPNPVFPPKIDDLQMINRIGWRGFFKLQLFRPEYIEVHETSGSVN